MAQTRRDGRVVANTSLPRVLYEKCEQDARAERRTLSSWMRLAIEEYLIEHDLVTPEEIDALYERGGDS